MSKTTPPARVGIDPQLPADLAEALEVARSAALGAANLVGCVKTLRDPVNLFRAFYESLLTLGQRKTSIDAVLADLVPVADPNRLYGASCAHVAALQFRDRVLTIARDGCSGDFDRFRSIVQDGLLDDLPDAREVVAACDREAYAANAARNALPFLCPIARIPTPDGIPEPGTVNGRPGYFAVRTDRGRSTECCAWELPDGSIHWVWVGGWERLTGWNKLPPPGNEWLPQHWPTTHFPLGPHPLQSKHWLKSTEWLIRDLGETAYGPRGIDDPQWGWRSALCAARLLASRYAPNAAMTGKVYPTDSNDGIAEFLTIRDAINQAMTAAPIASPGTKTGGMNNEGAKPNATTDTILPALLSASDIAARINRKRESVTSFLTRLAEKRPDCRVENSSKRKNEPGYLYRTADVWPALENWMKADG